MTPQGGGAPAQSAIPVPVGAAHARFDGRGGAGAVAARVRVTDGWVLSGGARPVVMEPRLSELFGGFPGAAAGTMAAGGAAAPLSATRRSSRQTATSNGRSRGHGHGQGQGSSSSSGRAPAAASAPG
ncbi:hypothetical protein chiPu_0030320, partial [Chiloscyllium punctatum]|nr:hypothetical protein [Chiloscyllium punctatum]